MNIFKAPLKNYDLLGPRDRSEFDLLRHFDDLWNKSNYWGMSEMMPKVPMNMNVIESKEGYHLEAELPGVKREDVHVSMKDDFLVIRGDKKSYVEDKKEQYHRIERSHGSFYRAVQLPKDIDREKIHAELIDGVLKVDVMKHSSIPQDGKRIEVK